MPLPASAAPPPPSLRSLGVAAGLLGSALAWGTPAPPPLTTPTPEAALFDPANTQWTEARVEEAFRRIQVAPLPSERLGDPSGLAPVGGLRWAWFSAELTADSHGSFGVQSAGNSLGRSAVPGHQLATRLVENRLRGLPHWRRRAVTPERAELVVCIAIVGYQATEWGAAYLLEGVLLDQDDQLLGAFQTAAGSAHPPPLARFGAPPNPQERFDTLEHGLIDAADALAQALRSHFRQPGTAVARAAPLPRPAYLDDGAEELGPLVLDQVRGLLAELSDPEATVSSRRDAARSLGRIGSVAAIDRLGELARHRHTPAPVREAAVWALGEIAHPTAESSIRAARVSPAVRRFALLKTGGW